MIDGIRILIIQARLAVGRARTAVVTLRLRPFSCCQYHALIPMYNKYNKNITKVLTFTARALALHPSRRQERNVSRIRLVILRCQCMSLTSEFCGTYIVFIYIYKVIFCNTLNIPT